MVEMTDKNLEKVYEQYWLHARHQEIQRLWFTNIYAMIVAGVFAYLGLIEEHLTKILILIFLTILSLFGYLMAHSWNLPFVIFSRLAEEIAICEWNLPEKYQRFSKYGKGYEYHKYIGFGKNIAMRTSAARVFMLFYSLMIGIFGALIVQTIDDHIEPTGAICNITEYYAVLIALVLFIIFYLSYYFYWEPKTIGKIQSDFDSRIEKYHQKSMTKLEEKG
jgi:hypothetical protein